MSYEKEILLRIHRDYTESEVVCLAVSIVKNQDFKLGQIKSYVSELEDKIKGKNKELQALRMAIKSRNEEIKAKDNELKTMRGMCCSDFYLGSLERCCKSLLSAIDDDGDIDPHIDGLRALLDK